MSPPSPPSILTINGGSSSLKFALFSATPTPTRLLTAQLERLGSPSAALHISEPTSKTPQIIPIPAGSFTDSLVPITNFLRTRLSDLTLLATGHRIVHGGLRLTSHQPITPDLLAELHRTQSIDLAHLPREIALIDSFGSAFPKVPQVACFDTAFHRDLPRIAQLLPIPRRYLDAGIRKLGFHGLSYTYLMSELARIAGPAVASSRVILAHLGAGASMAAVHHCKPIDTTMAFTPTSGLVMATRPGDLDPGLLLYLAKDLSLPPDQMENFISQKCGLLGVSDTSADIRDLLSASPTDPRAAEAIALFCYHARKHLAALTATLGGVDTLIFSGGIGEHAPEIRAAICDNLTYLGITLNPDANAANHPVISSPTSRVSVRIIPTDEELTIARAVQLQLTAHPRLTVPRQ